MKNLKAILDLGTLKAKLSIFDKDKLDLIDRHSHLTLLGKKIEETKQIQPESLEKLNEALKKYKDLLNSQNITEVEIIATEAIRTAENKFEIENLVQQYFLNSKIKILTQNEEGELFFNIVAKYFPDEEITTIDIGGGSVQIYFGKYDSSSQTLEVKDHHLFRTGAYFMQQKYTNGLDEVITTYPQAISDLSKIYSKVKHKSNLIIFGSSTMQDFIEKTNISSFNNKSKLKHSSFTTTEELQKFFNILKDLAPRDRHHRYPEDIDFIHGADFLLLNILELAKRVEAKYIYPTNLNSSYALV